MKGCLDGRASLMAHKLPRVASCLSVSRSLPSGPNVLSYYCQDGQHRNGVPYKSPGGSRSCSLNRHMRHLLLLWAQDRFPLLTAVHIPGTLNLAAGSDLEPFPRDSRWTSLRRKTQFSVICGSPCLIRHLWGYIILLIHGRI